MNEEWSVVVSPKLIYVAIGIPLQNDLEPNVKKILRPSSRPPVNMTISLKANLRRKRQPVGNEDEPNLTIFFKCFLITPEGMDADLGFSVTPQ